MREKDVMNQITEIIHDKIKSDDDIKKILFYRESNVDIYAQKPLNKEDSKIALSRISKHKRKPSDKEKECYITMWYGGKVYHHQKNIYFNGNTFWIGVFCDTSIVYNDFIGDRVCAIESIIAELFDGQDIGASCLCTMLDSVDVDVNGTDYSGRKILIGFNDHNVKRSK